MGVERLAAPFGSFADLVRENARERPSRAAIIHGDRVMDYAALDLAIDRLAAGLQRRGVGPRDVVAICGGTSIEYLVLFLACLRAGAAAALISPALPPATIERMVADAGARCAFFEADIARVLDEPAATPERVEILPDWSFNIIYSSGTTGEPKGIVQPHGMRWTHLQ